MAEADYCTGGADILMFEIGKKRGDGMSPAVRGVRLVVGQCDVADDMTLSHIVRRPQIYMFSRFA